MLCVSFFFFPPSCFHPLLHEDLEGRRGVGAGRPGLGSSWVVTQVTMKKKVYFCLVGTRLPGKQGFSCQDLMASI